MTSTAIPFSRTSRRGLASTLALAAACVGLAPSAWSISMRDDVPNVNSTGNDNPYVALGANAVFDAVAFMSFTNTNGSTYTGTGMLVQTTTAGVFKFLTAAHNVDTSGGGAGGTGPNGVPDANSYDLYFGARTSADGSTSTAHVTAPASSVSIMSMWVSGGNGLGASSSQYDLAVITINLGMVVSGTLPTARLGFSTASPAGKTGTMVGYGSYGLGNSFAANAADGVRRGGRNVIDFYAAANSPANTGFSVQTDFDSPTDTNKSTLGSPLPLSLEASTAGGDSGGPLLVQDAFGQYQIVGVLNGGYGGTGGNPSEYGDRSIWASVAQSDNYAYLLSQGIAVPEPSTYALLALGLAALAILARRRGMADAR